MRIFLLSMTVILFLFCTVRLPAQTTSGTTQVSPVASLQGSNASVMNNNIQILQSGVNSLVYLYGQLGAYFTNGILNTSAGGTGSNLSTATPGYTIIVGTQDTLVAAPPVISHGNYAFTSSGTFTPATSETVFVTMVGGGCSGFVGINNIGGGGAAGVLNFPYYVTGTTTVTVGNGGTGSYGSGGDSSFGTLVANGCNAGNIGRFNASSSANFFTPMNGVNSASAGQYFQIGGGNGSNAATGTGGGGGSLLGIGGADNLSGNCVSTAGYGAGGGGAGIGFTSCSGGNGIVIVQY